MRTPLLLCVVVTLALAPARAQAAPQDVVATHAAIVAGYALARAGVAAINVKSAFRVLVRHQGETRSFSLQWEAATAHGGIPNRKIVAASGAMIVMSTPRRLGTPNLSVPVRSNNRDWSAEPPRRAPADQASTTTVS